MFTNDYDKKQFKWSVVIGVVITVIFTLCMLISLVDFSIIEITSGLLLGWILGSLVIIIHQFTFIALIAYLYKKNLGVKKTVMLKILQHTTSYILHAIIVIAIIAINQYSNGHSFSDSSKYAMNFPFSIFTYLGAMLIQPAAILLTYTERGKHGSN